VVVAAVALFFSILFIYYSRNTGQTWYVVWGPFLMSAVAGLVGIPVYLAQRPSMTAAERI
jgi:basic amino acid/polyamine antiporter, APA family